MVLTLTEGEHVDSRRVDSFITSLSSINFVFAFAMNLFNFTVLVLLKTSGLSIVYGGIGISAGQAFLLLAVIPFGRAIDKGKSYLLLAVGSTFYGLVLVGLFFGTLGTGYAAAIAVTSLIALTLVFQNLFKSSLSSFVAKSVRTKIMGRSYSRLIWMETAGGTLSFFLVYFSGVFISMREIYLFTGVVLFVVSVTSFLFTSRSSREALKLRLEKTTRPSFSGSLRALRRRGTFVVALLSSKVFMSVGILGFSYFYLVIGEGIGAGIYLPLLALGSASAVGVLWGIYSERFVIRRPEWGKAYIVIMALLDVVSYLLILASIENHSLALFLAAPIIGSPGPFLIPGAMAYEVKVVGKENRGMFSGIQRTLTGIPAIALGAPLTYLFTVSPFLMWSIISGSAVATLVSSLLIPSRKRLESDGEMKDYPSAQ